MNCHVSKREDIVPPPPKQPPRSTGSGSGSGSGRGSSGYNGLTWSI